MNLNATVLLSLEANNLNIQAGHEKDVGGKHTSPHFHGAGNNPTNSSVLDSGSAAAQRHMTLLEAHYE